MYDDYYGPSEYDEQVEEFKTTLRESVKAETREELAKLRSENAEMRGKLKDLDKLTRDAELSKHRYEREVESAKRSALADVRRESAASLLAVLSEPAWLVRMTWEYGPKCDECDSERYLRYKTPRGNNASERCECAEERHPHYYVSEFVAWSAAHRDRKLIVWYTPVSQLADDPQWSTSTTKNPAGVSLEARCKDYKEYGYVSKDAAQEVADALNAQVAATEATDE